MKSGANWLAIAGLVLGLPAAAEAGVVVKSVDFGLDAVPANSLVVDFDAPLPTGFTLTGGQIRNWSDSLGAAPAWATGQQDTSYYLSANAGDTATLTADRGYRSVSFMWGSMDDYNTLTLLGAGGSAIASYTGLQVWPPANGDQGAAATNRRVTFTTDGATSLIYGLRFASGQPAFEIDNVAFSDPVPEPATWAMMIAGFALIGGALRRRVRVAAVA